MYLGLGRGERLLPGIQIKIKIMNNINNRIHKNIVNIETYKSLKGFVTGLNEIQSKKMLLWICIWLYSRKIENGGISKTQHTCRVYKFVS